MKLSLKEIKEYLNGSNLVIDQLNDCPYIEVFFKTHDWDGGYESFHGYNGDRYEFYCDMNIMLSLVKDFIRINSETVCIIAPFHSYSYFEHWSDRYRNDIYKEIRAILKERNIDYRYQCGMMVDLSNEFSVLRKFIEGGFRYISLASFYFPNSKTLITPRHHMDYMIINADIDVSEKLFREIVCNYSDLGIEVWKK